MSKYVLRGITALLKSYNLVFSGCLLTAGKYEGVINRAEVRFGLDNTTEAVKALYIEVSVKVKFVFFHLTFRSTGRSAKRLARRLLSYGVRSGEEIGELKGQPISLIVAHLEEMGYFIKEVSVGTKSMTKSEEETQ